MKTLDYIFLALFFILIGLTIFFIARLTTDGGQCVLSPEKYLAEHLQSANLGKEVSCSCSIYSYGMPYVINFNSTNKWTKSNEINNPMVNSVNLSLLK